jgi:hypothetical protein
MNTMNTKQMMQSRRDFNHQWTEIEDIKAVNSFNYLEMVLTKGNEVDVEVEIQKRVTVFLGP